MKVFLDYIYTDSSANSAATVLVVCEDNEDPIKKAKSFVCDFPSLVNGDHDVHEVDLTKNSEIFCQ